MEGPLAGITDAEWRVLHENVYLFACSRTRSRDQALDLTWRAFGALWATRPWDPTRQPSLAKHLMGVVRSLASHDRTSKRAENERAAGAEWAGDGAMRSAESMHIEREEAAERKEKAARTLAALRARLAHLPLELAVIDEMIDDDATPAIIAARLGRPAPAIYDALERIRRYMRALAREAVSKDGSEEEAP